MDGHVSGPPRDRVAKVSVIIHNTCYPRGGNDAGAERPRDI